MLVSSVYKLIYCGGTFSKNMLSWTKHIWDINVFAPTYFHKQWNLSLLKIWGCKWDLTAKTTEQNMYSNRTDIFWTSCKRYTLPSVIANGSCNPNDKKMHWSVVMLKVVCFWMCSSYCHFSHFKIQLQNYNNFAMLSPKVELYFYPCYRSISTARKFNVYQYVHSTNSSIFPADKHQQESCRSMIGLALSPERADWSLGLSKWFQVR